MKGTGEAEPPQGAGGRGRGAGPRAARIENFRDLRVWQGAMDLVESVYRLSSRFPSDEAYGLRSQIRRAAVSVPSNIAEGHTRASTREYLNYLSIGQSSLAEVETQFEISVRLKYLSREEVIEAISAIHLLGRQLYALRNALETRK